MKQLADLDFLKASKIIGAMFDPVASDVTSPAESQLWYNTTLDRFRGYDGAANFTVPRIDSAEAVTGVWNWNPGSGTVPFTVQSGKDSVVTNLNADLLDNYHAASAATADTIALRSGAGALAVATPTLDGHATTKAYVDAVAAGNDWKASCLVATTTVLPSYTHSSGVLTATVNGAIGSIDGVALSLNDRVLVKDETGGNAPYNGLFFVSAVGDLSNPWELTRTTDADADAEVTSGLTTYIEAGTSNAGAGYTLTSTDPITVGTTDIGFAQTSGSNIFTAGNGMVKAGSVFHFAQSTAYSVGSIPYASGTATITMLSAGATGNVLKGAGASAPVWAQVDLTADVTGVLPVANGGSGTSTQMTQGSVVFAGSSGVYSQDASNLFWDDSLNELGVGTNSPSNTLTVSGDADVTGNLGIGEATPLVALHIVDSAAEMIRLESSSITGAPAISIFQTVTERAGIAFQDSGNFLLFKSFYGGFQFHADTAGTPAGVATITSAGWVSIASTNTAPDAPLHVAGPDGVGAFASFGSDAVAIFDNGDAVGDDAYAYIMAGTSGIAGLYFGDDDSGSQGGVLYNNSGNTLTLRAGAVDALAVGSDGELTFNVLNVGVGASVMTEESGIVHARTVDTKVFGSSLIEGTGTATNLAKWSDTDTLNDSAISDDGTTVQVLDRTTSFNTTSATGNPQIDFAQAGTQRAYLKYEDSGDTLEVRSLYGGQQWFTGTAGAATRRMYLHSNGKLGLGTNTSLRAQLHVSGPDGHGASTGFNTDAVAIFDNADTSADNSYVYVVAGNAARSAIFFGDPDEEQAAGIDFYHSIDTLILRSGSSGSNLACLPDLTVQISNLATGVSDSVVTEEDSGVLHKRTIDDRVWGATLLDGSGTATYLPKFSDADTLTDSAIKDDTSSIVFEARNLKIQSDDTQIIGGIGANTGAGTNDWSNADTARSGNGQYLMLATDTDGPGDIDGSEFFHSFSFEYDSKDGTGNLTQFAIPYNKNRMYFRRRFSAVFSSWLHVWTEGYMGAGTGLDADLLDGQEGTYYLDLANTTGDTDDITEGATNLYYTDARARGSISSAAAAELDYNSSTGVLGLGTEAGRVKSGTIGDGAATSIGFTHSLGTRNVIVQVFRTATPYDTIQCDVERNTTNQVSIEFSVAPASAEYTVVCIAANG